MQFARTPILICTMLVGLTHLHAQSPVNGKLNYPTHAALVSGFTASAISSGAISAEQDGYAASGDGGGADYDWSPTSNAPADGVFVMMASGQTAGSNGRLVLRIPGGGVHPEVAGAVGYRYDQQWDANGQTIASFTPPDDSTPLNNLAYYITTYRGEGTILPIGGKFYNHNSNFLIGRHVAFRCEGNPLGQTKQYKWCRISGRL